MGKLYKDDVLSYIKEGYDTFIETGTGPGAITVNNLKDSFPNLYSIEISKEIFEINQKSLIENKNVNLFLGDSSFLLEEIVEKNKEKKMCDLVGCTLFRRKYRKERKIWGMSNN